MSDLEDFAAEWMEIGRTVERQTIMTELGRFDLGTPGGDARLLAVARWLRESHGYLMAEELARELVAAGWW